MNLLSKLFGRRSEQRAITNLPDQVGIFATASLNDTGVAVTEMTALAASAVYACCAVLSQAVAALPVHVISRKNGEKQYDHPAALLLGSEPNEYQTSPMWRENQVLQLMLWGNCYSFIERDAQGRPIALLPLRSDSTLPVRFNGGQLVYRTTTCGGTDYLPPQDVLHIANMSIDGVTGLSPIMQAKQSVGLSLGLERFAAKFFGQGCHAGGILTVPSLKSEGMKEFAKKFRENYTGTENSWKVAVLEAQMSYTPTTVDPEKSQALQQRVHQLREVARIYRVPPHKIGDLERATFSNIEFQSMEFVQDSLMPWVIKWEAECQRKLLLEREKPELEVRFNLDALLRADTKSRYEAHAVAINAGFMSVNEARAKENLKPVDGGDVLRWPLNTAPVGQQQPVQEPSTARALVEDCAKRLLTKESRAIAKAAKKHSGNSAEFRTWADEWYRRHEPLVGRTVAAPFKAAGIAGTETAYAKKHCDESRAAVQAAFDAGTVDDLVDEFETIRPGSIAEQLIK